MGVPKDASSIEGMFCSEKQESRSYQEHMITLDYSVMVWCR